jgi:signal transduction histidine kinase
MNDTRCTVGDVVQDESRSFEKILRTGKPRKSSKQAEAKALLQMLPGARTVVLFPLWDSHRERWFAGSFAWTTRSTRVLTRAEDLSYLAAFGNSIMAEVARLDTIAANRAKSDFISSISHELRSPLHGILASVEFLQDTGVDLFQNSMIDTIERCGRTLLDTIQHVLDLRRSTISLSQKGI